MNGDLKIDGRLEDVVLGTDKCWSCLMIVSHDIWMGTTWCTMPLNDTAMIVLATSAFIVIARQVKNGRQFFRMPARQQGSILIPLLVRDGDPSLGLDVLSCSSGGWSRLVCITPFKSFFFLQCTTARRRNDVHRHVTPLRPSQRRTNSASARL